MRGSVVKKGDRWYVKIELDPDPATGRRRQKWHSGYRTKREAERARVDLLSKFDRGEYVEPSHQTLADFLDEWLKAIEPTVRPSTFDSYSRNVRNHVIAHIGTVRLTKVDAGVLNGLYATLLASGPAPVRRGQGAGYSPAVVERALELARRGLSASRQPPTGSARRVARGRAHHQGHARLAAPARPRERRPARRPSAQGSTGGRSTTSTRSCTARSRTPSAGAGSPATRPTPPTRRAAARSPTASTPGTRRRCGSSSTRPAPADDRLHALWVLLATTGMRRGEALGLRWSDVDLDAGRLRVVQTIIQTRSMVSDRRAEDGARPAADRARPGDRRRAARAPPAHARGAPARRRRLRRPRPRLPPARRHLAPARRGQRRVPPPGSPLRPTAPHPAGPAPHLGDARPRAGIHPRVVQERLGHSTIAITLGIYSHVAPTLHDEAAQLVADLVRSAA